MRSYDPAEMAYLQSRAGYLVRGLFWVIPRDRTNNTRVGLGFWTGEDDASFTIDGFARTYVGGGALTGLDAIVMQAGLVLRMQRVAVSPLFPQVELLLRGYDAWRAPAQLHRALFDPATGALVAPPRRIWKGVIEAAPIQTPEIGGQPSAEISLASAAESLTHGLSLTRSDAVQSQFGGDRFNRYNDVSGSVPVFWGSRQAGQPKTGFVESIKLLAGGQLSDRLF
jgi:hypothetical protein